MHFNDIVTTLVIICDGILAESKQNKTADITVGRARLRVQRTQIETRRQAWLGVVMGLNYVFITRAFISKKFNLNPVGYMEPTDR